MNKCYGYGRHSTAKQGLTKDAQHDRCFAYWEHNLAHLDVEWGGFFYDEAISGKKPLSERPHGRVVYFLARETDHVVTARYDRCFRNALDGMIHLKAFEDRGVTFHSDKEKIDTSTAMGRAFRTMLLAMAEVERDLASERTLEIQASLKAAGRPHCKGCPIGWRIVRTVDGREYRVDDDERCLPGPWQRCTTTACLTSVSHGGQRARLSTRRSVATRLPTRSSGPCWLVSLASPRRSRTTVSSSGQYVTAA